MKGHYTAPQADIDGGQPYRNALSRYLTITALAAIHRDLDLPSHGGHYVRQARSCKVPGGLGREGMDSYAALMIVH